MSFWAALGTGLGFAYVYWARLLFFCCFGPNFIALALYLRRLDRSAPAFGVVLETVYGLLNPMLYLLILEPGLFPGAGILGEHAVSWALLGAYWVWQLFGASIDVRFRHARTIHIWLIDVCIVWVLAHGIRDALLAALGHFEMNAPFPIVIPVLASPLYFLPLAIAYRQRQKLLVGPVTDRGVARFRSRGSRWAAGICLTVLTLSVLVASRHPSLDEVHHTLLDHRVAIIDSARKANIDPGLVAALTVVTQRDYTTPFRTAVEEIAAGAWSLDLKSHYVISSALDPSLGPTQITPVTVLTALHLRDPVHYGGKQFRDVRLSSADFQRVRSPEIENVPLPAVLRGARKLEVVRALLSPASNFSICAFLLDVYATQWGAGRPDWSIRNRPEILATLFQIGFQHSFPKAHPHPNEFGKKVAAALKDPWIAAHFPQQRPAGEGGPIDRGRGAPRHHAVPAGD